jgi:hypothetical protein
LLLHRKPLTCGYVASAPWQAPLLQQLLLQCLQVLLLLLHERPAALLLAPWRLQVLQVMLLQLPFADSPTAAASGVVHCSLA